MSSTTAAGVETAVFAHLLRPDFTEAGAQVLASEETGVFVAAGPYGVGISFPTSEGAGVSTVHLPHNTTYTAVTFVVRAVYALVCHELDGAVR